MNDRFYPDAVLGPLEPLPSQSKAAPGVLLESAPDVLTSRDVADELQVSVSWVNAALRRGEIQCIVMGPRLRRVTRQQLEAYKARRAR